ncbi:hypothetical protein QW180_22535 [Vibrio sinaloensis]|nr:hypothetical protein [Vibrio sinaloensis]
MAKYTSNNDVFPFGRFMLNSFAISAGAAIVSLVFAVMGGLIPSLDCASVGKW